MKVQYNPYLPAVEVAELVGTEKQISWATDIRRGKLSDLETTIIWREDMLAEKVAAGTMTQERATELLTKTRCQYDALLACTDARFWIENRHLYGLDLFRKIDG